MSVDGPEVASLKHVLDGEPDEQAGRLPEVVGGGRKQDPPHDVHPPQGLERDVVVGEPLLPERIQDRRGPFLVSPHGGGRRDDRGTPHRNTDP